jgi:glutaredoxin
MNFKSKLCLVCLSVAVINLSLIFSAAAQIWEYKDASGKSFFVDNESRIPEKYRASAKESKKTINRVSLPTSSAAKTPQPKEEPSLLSKVGSSLGLVEPSKTKSVDYKNEKIEVFVTSWCPYCKQLESALKERKISFIRKDIEGNSVARKEFAKLGAGGGIPVTKIGDKIIHGANISEILATIGR